MGTTATAAIKTPGFLHSAIWLVACVAGVGSLLLPLAVNQPGTASPWGLLAAAGICLFSSLASEVIDFAINRPQIPNSSLISMLLGMGARMLPPLAVCCFLAVQGESGRQHLAFVGYLLAFYLVTLTVDTSLAVRRLAVRTTHLESSLS